MKDIACCGRVCSDCPEYKKACYGCNDSRGAASWTKDSPWNYCPLYVCCSMTSGADTCQDCEKAPCRLFKMCKGLNTSITDEELEAEIAVRMKTLKDEVPRARNPFSD